MKRETGLALLPPIGASAVHWLCWPWLSPSIWLLFYPAVFLSGMIGGFRGGMAGTFLSVALVWFVPQLTGVEAEYRRVPATMVFALMGYALSRTHENLRHRQADSDARFFAMFETSASGVAIVARDRRFLRVNSKLCEMLAYRPEELLTKTFLDITHPDDVAGSLALRESLLTGGPAPAPMEKRYQRKDGTYLWVSVGLSIAKRRGGKPEHYIAVVEDIDVRKKAELELRAARAMLESALSGMSEAVVIMDVDGNVQHFNDAFVSLNGFASAADTLRNCSDYLELLELRTEDGAQLSVNEWPGPRALAGETVSGAEYDVRRKDTGKTWIGSYNFAPIRGAHGAITGAVITARDITKPKQVECALRESEQRLHLFIEHAPAALAMFDRKMRYIAVSRRWLEQHGLVADVIGRSSYETFPDTPPRWRDAHARGLAGEVVRNNQDRIQRADGTVQWLRWEIHPWRLSDGSVGGILVFAEDVTKLHSAREEVLRLNADLERRVEERTAELIEARARAEAANAAKSAFLANISHEIRTPMNAILGFTSLLRREVNTNLESERLENIDRAGKHLLAVINDVLDLSKIEAGQLRLQERDFDLGQVLADVSSLIAAPAKAKGIVVRIDTDHMPRRVRGDDVRIRQALLNFANNAVKFTMYGSIDLRVILIKEDEDRLLARFEVEDTGMGVEPQFVPKLFKPFEQGDVSTTRKFGGTGLGLTITRRLAEMMDGEAGVETRAGVGSTFWFTARLKSNVGVAVVPEVHPGIARCRTGARILLAEDNAINRQVATQLLISFNLRVETAEDGVEALEKARAGDYDLVLMDVQMPKMDGVEATRRLRALEGWAGKPIIALTANIFEDDRRACAEAGMNDFIPKPVDPDELYRVLARWVPAEEGAGAGAMDERTAALIERLTAVGLDAKAGLNRVAGDASLYGKLLSRFADERRDSADRLAAAAGRDERARMAHELKGVAGTLGATKVQTAAGAIEAALSSGAADSEIDARIAGLKPELESLIDVIHDALPDAPADAPAPETDAAALRHALREMEAALADGDVRANEMVAYWAPSLIAAFGADGDLLRREIENYAYPEAARTLRRLIEEGAAA